VNLVRRFLGFWWSFIVGDDWRIAALVVIGLGLCAAAAHGGLAAWWIPCVVVAAALWLSVWRAARRAPRREGG